MSKYRIVIRREGDHYVRRPVWTLAGWLRNTIRHKALVALAIQTLYNWSHWRAARNINKDAGPFRFLPLADFDTARRWLRLNNIEVPTDPSCVVPSAAWRQEQQRQEKQTT